MGVAPDEIRFTRNATEAMKALILQYNRLKPGDAVLYADLDYDSMQASMDRLRAARREGDQDRAAGAGDAPVRDRYLLAAFKANPAIKMVLMTHLSHRTGLVLPVAEIATMARAARDRLDCRCCSQRRSARLSLPDLKADFIGINLHKWIGAPLGVGAIYVRRERIGAIDPDPAENPDRAPTSSLAFIPARRIIPLS